jgi:hypothetical protein
VAHPATAGFEERAAEVWDFYSGDDAARRAALLDRLCLTHVVLPGGGGDAPDAWLGPATPFRRVARAGSGAAVLDAFKRTGGSPCPRPR